MGAYLQACKKAVKRIGAKPLEKAIGAETFSPHPMRHSAQTHLVQAEVSGEFIECAAGHVLPKVQRVYRPHPLGATRKALAVLSTLVPCPKGL